MDAFTDPQVRLLSYYVGAALILIPLLLTIYFAAQRIRKIRLLAEKRPDQEQSYHPLRLFGDYLLYAFLVFIGTAIIASLPIVGAIYLGALLAQITIPVTTLINIGACLGLIAGGYTTIRFLHAKTNYEESLLSPTI
ncbi:hypothetical protein KDA_24030 [Dictyobacter alpinus]|uniref:Uncharacterized protein n=1 Tax=Dictyobacter alpinus TaxID=2014873 RepID=A0A402B6F6_9CHLR|nr:hypothetical protein [Dictyobacter alpinus]GCE26919.1 hypothetical protein KDA_24030 [Dictyobacter alpinus]